jgi:hypothetical protein
MKLTYVATAGLILLVSAGVYLVVQNDTEGRLHEMQAKMQADFDRKYQQKEKDLKDEAEEVQRKLKAAAEAAKPATVKSANGAGDPTVPKALANVKEQLKNNGAAPGNTDLENEVPAPLSPDEARIRNAEEEILNPTGAATERVAIESARARGIITEEDNSEKLNDLQSLIVAQPRIARVGDARAAEDAGFVVLDEGLNKGLVKGDRFAVRRGTILVARITVSDNIQATQCVADIAPNSIVPGMAIKNGDDVIKFDR